MRHADRSLLHDRLDVRGVAGERPHARVEDDLDPLVFECCVQRRSRFRVGARGDLRTVVDDRHPRAEAREDLRELESDRAAADDEQRFRHLFQLERADVVDPVDVLESGNRWHRGTTASGDQDLVGRQRLAVDANRLAVDERRLTGIHAVAGVPEQLDPALLISDQ